MKKPDIVKYSVLAVAVILALVFLFRSCSLYDEVSVLKGKHEALQVAYADLDLRAKAHIGELEADIAARDEEIAKLNVRIAGVKDKIEAKDKTIANLEAEFVELGEDKDAKIVNLQAQVAAWREKFTLAEAVIADKDGIIFSLTVKYESAVKISSEWKAAYERQVELNTVCQERIKAMEGEWKGLKFGSKLKTYGILAAAGWIVYSMVKK